MNRTTMLFDPPLRGKVEKSITPNHPGRVRTMGSHWDAQYYGWNYRQTLHPGQIVMVIAQRGNTMLVMPIAEVP